MILKVMRLFLFFFLASIFPCKAQETYYEIKISNDACNYSVQIDSALNDTSKIYRLSHFMFEGVTRKAANTIRKKLNLSAGHRLWFDKKSIEEKNAQICGLRKFKLSRVEFLHEKNETYEYMVSVRYYFTH